MERSLSTVTFVFLKKTLGALVAFVGAGCRSLAREWRPAAAGDVGNRCPLLVRFEGATVRAAVVGIAQIVFSVHRDQPVLTHLFVDRPRAK